MQGLIVLLFVIHHKIPGPSLQSRTCLLVANLPLDEPSLPGLLQCYTNNRQSSANCCIGSRLYVALPLTGLTHEERRCTGLRDNQALIDMHRVL
jgi:hypothetical protein